MARELNVHHKTIQIAVHGDLGMKSFARTPKHLLTVKMKARRFERCKKVLQYYKSSGGKVKIFSDKKIFTLDAVVNRRNDRYLAISIDQVEGQYRTKHPQQTMCLGVVASDGQKMPPYFFKPGEKVDTAAYYKVLRYTVLPWLKSTYPSGNYTWTQDGAPCHTSKKVQDFCRANMADFWPADMWPSSSPDLNPLDFSVWSVLESHACKTSHANLTSLQQAIVEAWDNLTEEYIKKSCAGVRRRVEAVIANNGGHIE
ncbi:Putative transposable element [Caligus rogercresseyi]|uniref:Transposable element n=2 Tax=Caligus rogercresseyi TaxID=217165 RepID=A0A7T8GU85_CALRO|nr:Putative transposable element [Caligus rogercresseyi]